jgi:hypothetical protein
LNRLISDLWLISGDDDEVFSDEEFEAELQRKRETQRKPVVQLFSQVIFTYLILNLCVLVAHIDLIKFSLCGIALVALVTLVRLCIIISLQSLQLV